MSPQETASDLILATTWDGELDEARATRDKLAATLNITLPKMVTKTGGDANKLNAAEKSSYQSLLDDAARGY